MGYCSIDDWNLYHILLSGFCSFCDGGGYLTGLSEATADCSFTVTYNNDGSECEGSTTFCYLGNAVNSYELIFKLRLAICFYFINCHNCYLEIKSTITSCISKLFYTTMIEVSITVENNTCYTGS